jgi:hypothetical protein
MRLLKSNSDDLLSSSAICFGLAVTALNILVFAVGVAACTETPGSPDQAGSDAAAVAKDAATEFPDSAEPGDVDLLADADTPVEWLGLDSPELWTEGSPCESLTEVPPAHDGDYIVSDFGPSPLYGATYADARRLLGVDADRTFWGITAAPRHEPGQQLVYDLHETENGAVDLEVFVRNHRIPGPNGEAGFETHTFLLDYQPVSARIRHLSSDRGRVIHERTGSSHFFVPTEPMSILEVQFPAELFEHGKMYEISWVMTTGRIRGGINAESRRIPLFYGGLEPARKSIPCATPPLEVPTTSVERELLRQLNGTVLLFTNPAPLRRTIRTVAPGTTQRIYFSILPQTLNGPHTIELTPTLNGEPVGDSQWVQHSGPNAVFDRSMVDARGYFDVTLPSEPGMYLVGITGTQDPYKRWRDFGSSEPRRGFENVLNDEVLSSAAPLWFEVVE